MKKPYRDSCPKVFDQTRNVCGSNRAVESLCLLVPSAWSEYVEVSWNGATPKSSIFRGFSWFSLIIQPFGDNPHFRRPLCLFWILRYPKAMEAPRLWKPQSLQRWWQGDACRAIWNRNRGKHLSFCPTDGSKFNKDWCSVKIISYNWWFISKGMFTYNFPFQVCGRFPTQLQGSEMTF